jgi:NitT/TauT family transport system substrate-binding protein
MNAQRADGWTRRRFLGGLTLAGTAGLLGLHSRPIAAEPPPETTTLRLLDVPTLCWAPQYVAEELLRVEGFSQLQYIEKEVGPGTYQAVGSGEVDMTMGITGGLVMQIDAGSPMAILAGVHVGCYELFGTDRVRAIRDLKGKTVAVTGLGGGAHVTLATILAYVGIDPRQDVTWVAHPAVESIRLLANGQIDAYMAFPPEPQELRATKVGHVLVSTGLDRPWSHHFCCMISGNREFVRKHPVATKRALRAILKAAELCALEPERVAGSLIEKGYARRHDYAVEAMRAVRYDKWREYDPEDTVRFYALRLHEVGMIKSTPQKIIAQGTDWRFSNELKKELKG